MWFRTQAGWSSSVRLLKCVQPLSVIAVWFVSHLPWINSGMMQFVIICRRDSVMVTLSFSYALTAHKQLTMDRHLIANYYGDSSILLEYILSFH